MHRTILYIKRCSCCRGIFPLIDLRWYTFLSFSRICVENSLRGRFLLFLLWADYRQEYHSFRWIIWPYSLISAGKKRCLYRRTLSEQSLLVYVKITELTIEERGNVRHWAACRAKAGGRKNPAGFVGTKKYGGKRKDKDEDSIRAGGVPGAGQCIHTQQDR